MNNYKYILEKYTGKKSRHTCPNCNHKHEFTLYIDGETGQPVSPIVGKCNRIDKCGYHFTPREFFSRNGNPGYFVSDHADVKINNVSISYIDKKHLAASLSYENYVNNNFTLFLDGLFGEEITNHLINIYKIGTSSRYNGRTTVFWQIDSNGLIRTGKLIKYDKNGQRIKGCTNWVHSFLNQDNYVLRQCLFGEHLLQCNVSATIGIVESEKTAVIMTAIMPDIIWLASGGSEGLNQEKVKVLKERDVVLFPDTSEDKRMYLRWEQKAKGFGFGISDYLEKYASEKQKQKGADIADMIIDDIKTSTIYNYNNF